MIEPAKLLKVLNNCLLSLAKQQQRVFRERNNIFQEYTDAELIRRYRLNLAGIVAVTDLVTDAIHSGTCRNRALPPVLKVAIALRY